MNRFNELAMIYLWIQHNQQIVYRYFNKTIPGQLLNKTQKYYPKIFLACLMGLSGPGLGSSGLESDLTTRP